MAALDWLRENTSPDDVVLCLLTVGQYVPALSGDTAFLAHWAQTLDFYNKRNCVACLARMVKAVVEQGGLLTITELNAILNRSYEVTRQYVRQWEEETDELLPLKSYRMDQGSRPTYKKEIVWLYEQGLDPPDIARETGHSLKERRAIPEGL